MFKKPWVQTLYSSNTVSIFLTLPLHSAILTILVAVDEQLAKHQHNRVVVSHQYVDESQICHEGWKIALKKDDIMKTLSEWNSKQTKNIHTHTQKNRKKNASFCFVFVCSFVFFLVFYYIRRVRRLMIIISPTEFTFKPPLAEFEPIFLAHLQADWSWLITTDF